MATALDIITRAYRKAGVLGQEESLLDTYGTNGLVALNSMLHEWKLRGVDISHVDLALDDTFPLAPEFERGTVFLLAAEVGPDYELPPRFDADDFFLAIQAAYLAISEVTINDGLLGMPSQEKYYF